MPVVSSAAEFWVVTQRFSPRAVTTLKASAEETIMPDAAVMWTSKQGDHTTVHLVP